MKVIFKFFLPALLFFPPVLRAQNGGPVLNHIAVYVQDLRVSTDFYANMIGLDTIPEPFHDGKHTWFRVGDNSHLHVISGAKKKEAHDKNAHLCFSVPSIETVIERLNNNHISYESWAGKVSDVTLRVDGIKQIYFRDPDGYWIEINNDYPKAGTQ